MKLTKLKKKAQEVSHGLSFTVELVIIAIIIVIAAILIIYWTGGGGKIISSIFGR